VTGARNFINNSERQLLLFKAKIGLLILFLLDMMQSRIPFNVQP
jgi:hypothetical protein